MQPRCYSTDEFHPIPSRIGELKKCRRQLLSCVHHRSQNCLFIVRKGEGVWYLVLVNSDKTKEFLENPDLDHGIIISFGVGNIPKEISNHAEIRDFIKEDLLLVRLHKEGCDGICYVLCDPGRKLQVMEATSVEEIGLHGKILHVANDEDDPPEALSCKIIKNILQSGSVHPISMSRHCRAVRSGDIQKVKEYLREISVPFSCNLNSTEQNGWTLLHHAAQCGNLDIIRLLAMNGYNNHARDTTCGRLPAHFAARGGHINAVEEFLDNGVDVNEIDENSWTLLHYAAFGGNRETARLLILKGADVGARDTCLGRTPMHVCAGEGHTEVVKVLLDGGAGIDDRDDIGQTPLYRAALEGCVDTARFLIGRGANVEMSEIYFGANPVHIAAYMDEKEVLEFLLDHGLNIQSQSEKFCLTPLHFAALAGSLNCARLLLGRGADLYALDVEGQTPFERAEDHMDVALYLSVEIVKKFKIHGKYDDALKIYGKLLEFQIEKLGPDHTETLNTRSNMAKIMYEKGQFCEALDILKDVQARRGSGSKNTLLSKCELCLSIRDAQVKYNEVKEGLKEVFKKCETDLSSDLDLHDPLSVACDIAHVYFRNCEYDKMFHVLSSVLERKEPSDGVVSTASLRKGSGISPKNKIENKSSQQTKSIFETVKVICGCIKICFCIFILTSIVFNCGMFKT